MPQEPPTDLFQSSTMTFGQHLEELRTCLFRVIAGLAVGCCLGFLVGDRVVNFVQIPVKKALLTYYEKEAVDKSFSPQQKELLAEAGYKDEADLKWVQEVVATKKVSFDVISIDDVKFSNPQAEHVLTKPAGENPAESEPAEPQGLRKIVQFRPVADDPHVNMIGTGSQEAFMIWMKASMVVGAVLSGPWVFYQIWTFVAAGLYPHERRYVHIFLPVSIGLFLTGASLAFFVAFEKVLGFLLSFNRMMHVNPDLRINEWMSFVLLLPLGFGISFQLPLVMLFLERIGLITVQKYLASWRIAILVIFVLGMVLSPSGDPYSLLLMAGPLTILYFFGVLLCKVLPKTKSRFTEG